ncbi:hypothetical protein CK203_068281 [Vitis vinifera]|uniref:Uncharacterized protein n=1 Tax=Vitis vinifera TaxID=29760 RepID=A0A438E1D5_VITVI|nr:hypothetical protein CK203_068281 [Vitis vinifera]
MIMADGREAEVPRLSGLANGIVEEGKGDVLERDTQERMEEGNEMGKSCWQSSCLLRNKNSGDAKGSYSKLRSEEIFRMENCGFKGYNGWYSGDLG